MAEQDKKQKYSFAELFRKQTDGVGYRIEIPMIQRDYAQGRISDKVTDLRNDFVSALSDYLKDVTDTHDHSLSLTLVPGSKSVWYRSEQQIYTVDCKWSCTSYNE